MGHSAKRRANADRMKAKALVMRPWDTKAKSADHLAACSCYMCGNPRKHFGQVTKQEAISMLRAEDGL